jgi:aspartyl-tRNA(Asn)/glutamyl-tRNA(Gln) amidotransferase subunit B
MDNYETIVGMEIHVELKTKSKMFCGCKNDPFFAKTPNSYTCPVCLGMPGGLPIPNQKAIEWTILLGLALGCDIQLLSKFDRKNYFYPDLAKGYQISQYDMPFCKNGKIETEFGTVRINRVHLEEDTGKLLHTTVEKHKVTLVDFNRSGVPLVEIVTEADIRSGDQAKAFLKQLHQIIRYIDISDADMEKGSMRLEPNISVRHIGEKELPNYKVEVKNINSFNFVKKTIEYETKRHITLLSKGETPRQETRGWNENKNETFPQRMKETADDYRYFPEPDIPPIRLTQEHIESLRENLPELPQAKKIRFENEYDLNGYDSALLTDTVQIAYYFEEAIQDSTKLKNKITPKTIANWIINRKIDINTVLPGELIKRISDTTHVESLSPDELTQLVSDVLAENKTAVLDYQNGKIQALMFLVGMGMKKAKGKITADVLKLKIQEMSIK